MLYESETFDYKGKGGPSTPEGKERSSTNATTHGLFAKNLIMKGEDPRDFEQLLDELNDEFVPKTHVESSHVRDLAENEWRRRRIPGLEAIAMQAIENGQPSFKELNNLALYEQRLTRTYQSILKTLKALQAERMVEVGRNWRCAVLAYNYCKRENIPWDPSDHEFDFSVEYMEKQLRSNILLHKAFLCGHYTCTTREMDERFVKPAQK
jgi:hypothetical protein